MYTNLVLLITKLMYFKFLVLLFLFKVYNLPVAEVLDTIKRYENTKQLKYFLRFSYFTIIHN